MLENEFEYYLTHQKELATDYPDKYVVIVGESVLAAYSTYEEALYQSKQSMALGSFLIQRCIGGSAAYTSTFHSNVFIEDAQV